MTTTTDNAITSTSASSAAPDKKEAPASQPAAETKQEVKKDAVASPAPAPKSLLAEEATAPAKEEQKTEAKEGEKAAESAAEETVYELKLPEKSALAEKHLEGVKALAKELKLTKDQAQKMVERDSALVSEQLQAQNEAQKQQFNKLYDEYGEAVKSDKDFGGDRLPKTLENAKRFLRTYADADFRKIVENHPFGSHPGFIRMLARAGAASREDSTVGSASSPTPAAVNPAELFYGKPKQ